MNISKTGLTLVALLATGMSGILGSVAAETNEYEAKWILVGDSPLLDRSSKYLFNANIDAGIKYAHKALARSQSEYTWAIAQHNLCLAYLAKGDKSVAEQHCTKAKTATLPEARLALIKPGLYKVSQSRASGNDAIMLATVVTQNLEIANSSKDAARVALSN